MYIWVWLKLKQEVLCRFWSMFERLLKLKTSAFFMFPFKGVQCLVVEAHMAMGQNPNRTPSEHLNPATKIGAKMGGEFT